MYYDKRIRYLNYYESGIKLQNAGYVKFQVRDHICQMVIYIKGPRLMGSGEATVYLLPENPGGREEEDVYAENRKYNPGRRLSGSLNIRNGQGHCAVRFNADNMGDTGLRYDEVFGIRIELHEYQYLESEWIVVNFMPWKKEKPVVFNQCETKTELSGRTRDEEKQKEEKQEEPYQATVSLKVTPTSEYVWVEKAVNEESIMSENGEGEISEGKIDGNEINGEKIREERISEDNKGICAERSTEAGGREAVQYSSTKAAGEDIMIKNAGFSFRKDNSNRLGGMASEKRVPVGKGISMQEAVSIQEQITGEKGIFERESLPGQKTISGQKQKFGSRAGMEIQPGTGIDIGKNAQPETGIDTGKNAQLGTGIETGKNAQPGTGIETGMETQNRTGLEAELEMRKRAGLGKELETPKRNEIEAEEKTAQQSGRRAGQENKSKKIKEKRQTLEGDVLQGMRETENHELPEGMQFAEQELKPDKWEQLRKTYPIVHPIHEDEEYLKIAPKDFVIFTEKYQELVHNSFLLHGYYNYKHLILGKKEKNGKSVYYLGVPGTFHDREKAVAVMFGFEAFDGKREPAENGDFGYYLRRVEL